MGYRENNTVDSSLQRTEAIPKAMLKKVFYTQLLIIELSLCSIHSHAWSLFNTELVQVHKDIIQAYPAVDHINADALTALLSAISTKKTVLLDVREADEYSVSHLPGAVRVSPDSDETDLIRKLGEKIRDATVVFYCSVGQRSSALADKVQAALKNKGAAEVYNLEKGIFNWHNNQRPLENKKGATDFIHPYNFIWKALIKRDALVRYKVVLH